MLRCLLQCAQLSKYSLHLPDGDPMANQAGFPFPGAVTKADSRISPFQDFLRHIAANYLATFLPQRLLGEQGVNLVVDAA